MADLDGTPKDWFQELGYRLDVSVYCGGVYWAHLTSVTNPGFVVERYGRGGTRQEAAEVARHRWQVEQVGSEPGKHSGEDRRLP